MNKLKAAKLGGFLGTAGLTAALVGIAVSGTGAYFTDSAAGTMSANSGHLKLSTVGSTALSFGDLVPGTDKTDSVGYTVDTSGPSDVWLVFDSTTAGYQGFTGAKGSAKSPLVPDGGLGRYGHFAVSVNSGGALFQSYNLALDPAGSTSDPNGTAGCTTDAYGHGGSAQQATSAADTPPYCGVPTAIKLSSGLTSGQGGTVHLTFGLTGRQVQQNQTEWTVPFKIVATQAGIMPGAADF